MANGKQRTKGEPELLKSYWKWRGSARGTIFREVPVGKCPGRGPRKIDGVRLRNSAAAIKPFNSEEFKRLIGRNRKAEVIEVKKTLNRSVIGQALVAKYLFEAKYEGTTADAVIVCERRNSVLQRVCRQLKVKVWTPRRKFVVS